MHPGESTLPRYGLARPFVGERFLEGHGWDVCTVVHRPDDSDGELTVGVIRRTTASPGPGLPRVAISDELARESVAAVLVEPLMSAGDDVFGIAATVAGEGQAWRPQDISLDGEAVAGHEREYRGMWIAYCLTATLIVFVLAPAALRPDAVRLRQLTSDEAPLRQDWPD